MQASKKLYYCSERLKRGGIILSKEMLAKLEGLSALRLKSDSEIRLLEEDITLANRIFEVDTSGVEPLHSLADELTNCPLREDELSEACVSRENLLQNTKHTFEGFFVTPKITKNTKTQ